MKSLFVAWQDPDIRTWIPVGKLTRWDDLYIFAYTQGARLSQRFLPFGLMTEFDRVYVSRELFPLFANRVLPKSRPEYRDYLRWLGFDAEPVQDVDLLARSGGERATDSLEIFPDPEPTPDGYYEVFFFAHGLRYLSTPDQSRVKMLNSGERLFLARDVQNPVDKAALLMRTRDPVSLIGYCPRYYSSEFSTLLDRCGKDNVHLSVSKVSPDAPSQLRVLCHLRSPWPAGFIPFASDEYQPIVPFPDLAAVNG